MFKRLLDNKQLDVSKETNLEDLGLTAYPIAEEKLVYYVFEGTETMYRKLPFKSKINPA